MQSKGENDKDENEDDLLLILPLWYGNPKKDILHATEWIDCVEKANKLYHWESSTTIVCVENSLVDEAQIWYLSLVKKENLIHNEFLVTLFGCEK